MKSYEKIDYCDLCGSRKLKTIDAKIDMCKCFECGYLFVNPRPTLDAIKQYYSNSVNYNYWLGREKKFDELSNRRLNIVRKYKSSGKILDVGAGIGQFLYAAKKYFDVDGTEVAKNAIDIAKNKYGIQLRYGDLLEMKMDEKQYDCIVLFHVLEHVHYPGALLEKCRNLLKPDGVMIIAVPNDVKAFLKLPLKRLLRFLKIGHYKYYGKFGMPKIQIDASFGEIHLSQFTPAVLTKYFLRNNYEIIENSLDPYFIKADWKTKLCYNFFLMIKKLTGVNWYDTMLFVVRNKL